MTIYVFIWKTECMEWTLNNNKFLTLNSLTKHFFIQVLKAGIRELWSLEYEIEEIQTEFAKGIGSINIAELTDDFVEDVMLQSKPLQGILMAIRLRQKVSYSIIKLNYEKVNLWKYLVNINSGIKIYLK